MVEDRLDIPGAERDLFTRCVELKKLSILETILSLAKKQKKLLQDKKRLKKYIKWIGVDIDDYNKSRLSKGHLSDGTKVEVLSRLVGSGLLADFPSVEKPKAENENIIYNWKINKLQSPDETEFILYIKSTTFRTELEETRGFVTTVIDLNISQKKINNRRENIKKEIEGLDPEITDVDKYVDGFHYELF